MNSPFWVPKLLFLESVSIRNAWGCVWPKQGITCWIFCVVFTKTGLSGLSPYSFRGQAWPDLWPGMANVCYFHKLNNMLNM